MDGNYGKDDGVGIAIETLMINARIYQREAIVALHMYVNINTSVFYARWIRRRIRISSMRATSYIKGIVSEYVGFVDQNIYIYIHILRSAFLAELM